jgi:acetoin utilization deacetylase AcuC-like enzyme
MTPRVFPRALLISALILVPFTNGQNSVRCTVIRNGRDHVVISWKATPGRNYILEGTSSLTEPWQLAGDFTAAGTQLESNISVGKNVRFFRITEKERQISPYAQNIPRTAYAYDPRFANYYQNPSEVPQRVLSINKQLGDQALLQNLRPVVPIASPRVHIGKIHTVAHIDGIQAIPVDTASGATEKIGVIADLAVGYVLGAVRDVCENRVQNAFCNIRPPGHHQINFGASYGFCCYANVVIAARYALDQYPDMIKRVMIIDWDLHHGNGTQYFVQNDPAFLFYDTCAGGFYNGGDEARHGLMNFSSGIEGFSREWDQELLPLAREFKPDLILISAGFDSKRKDAMGGEDLTARGYSILTRKVMELAAEFAGGRIVSILEGGYADAGTFPGTFLGLMQCVENHVRTLMTGELQPETPFY